MLRTQAKTIVPKVREVLDEHALCEGVWRLIFCALPKTRLTWVALVPLDSDLEALVDYGRPLFRDLARALHTDVWFVGNNDYSGTEFASFDREGKRRWKATDRRAWDVKVGERVDRALEKAKTEAERRAAEKQWAPWREAARAKSAWGRLEREAGLRWEHAIDLIGHAKRAAWRKTVSYRPGPGPLPKKTKAPLLLEHRVTSDPPSAAVWSGEQFLANTPCTLRLPATGRCTVRLELPAHEPQSAEVSGGAPLHVSLKPLKPLGVARLEVSEGTRIWLDGVLVCQGHCELPVEAGVLHRAEPEVSGIRHPATRFKVPAGKLRRLELQVSLETGVRLVTV